MGAKKFKTVDVAGDAPSKKQSYEEKKAKRAAAEAVEVDTTTETNDEVVTEDAAAVEEVAPKVPVARRGKKYVAARGKIDKTRSYSLKEAIDLLKSVKFSKFEESLEAHLVLKDVVASMDVSFPHSTGRTMRVAILNEDIVAELTKGIINFDVLLATPADMGKITKFARLLGPRGLMPNPKNGTLTADPARKKAEFEGGKTTVKGEKKAPLMHTVVGKASMDTKDLSENIETLIKAFGPGKVLRLTVCTTMSPGIRVQL